MWRRMAMSTLPVDITDIDGEVRWGGGPLAVDRQTDMHRWIDGRVEKRDGGVAGLSMM